MYKTMIVKAAALAVLGAAFAAPAAAQSTGSFNATLNVTGMLAPGACNVNFTGGAEVDYGQIPNANLSATNYTPLAEHSKTLQVMCGANTPAYVSVQDNRNTSAIMDTAMKTALGDASLADTQVFGLGTNVENTSENIGAYTIKMGPADVVTTFGGGAVKQAAVLSSTDKAAWTASTLPVAMSGNAAQYYSAGEATSSATPVSGRTWSFPLTVKAALNTTTGLSVINSVPLDGSATFTVSYQ
jgi:type 1 fimbria pilin